MNDKIKFRGVQTILHEYCATSNCHGGAVAPKFDTYAEVMKFVTAGSPENSKLWDYLTTNDFNKAMPPVNSNHEMNITDKSLIFNWIKNGAKERPDLNDFRPAAVALIVTGCGSANCHNQATATGGWARAGFYADTLANASFRPWKTFATPRSASSTRGPLNTYDDIMMDIMYPKSARSNSSVQYINPTTLITYYVKGNYLNVSSSMVSRVDSTLLLANPFTGIYATSHQGDMAYGDGGLKAHEIALIKAWYFADPNVPTVWKYGNANAGIFKYRKTGTIIKQ